MLALYPIISTENLPPRVKKGMFGRMVEHLFDHPLFSEDFKVESTRLNAVCCQEVQWKRRTGQLRALRTRKEKQSTTDVNQERKEGRHTGREGDLKEATSNCRS